MTTEDMDACVLSHTEDLGDPRTGPAFERQQNSVRPICLATFARTRRRLERRHLGVTTRKCSDCTTS